MKLALQLFASAFVLPPVVPSHASIGVLLLSGRLVGQTPPQVRVTLDAPKLTRGGTSVVHVTVTIPPGYDVPAETVGSLRGAWLRVVDDREPDHLHSLIPTYPIPGRVALPSATHTVNALAYRDTLSVSLFVSTPAELTGTQTLVVEFGFQLCDARACLPFDTMRTRTDMTVSEPRHANANEIECCFTFTVDPTHVAILVDHELKSIDRPIELDAPHAAFGLAALTDDPTDIPASQFKGSTWVVGSDGRQFVAIVERFAAVGAYGSQPELALVARVDLPAFQRERTQYFVAWPRAEGTRPVETRSIARAVRFTDRRRLALETLIDAQMRITLPTVLAPSGLQLTPGSYDERVIAGKARLLYHVEGFKLAPDDDTRLFVRAHWVAAGRAQTGMTFWIRVHNDAFVVEDVDTSLTHFARESIVERETFIAAADSSG